MQQDGLVPDVYSYSSVISACSKVGHWEKALSLVRQMREAGLKPDVFVYANTIAACR